jgi:hypothetical protein
VTIIRQRRLRRIGVTGTWLVVAAAFAHLAVDSTRPRSIDLQGILTVAAAGAVLLAAITWFGRGQRLRTASAAAGLLTVAVALALIALRAAHETGLALVMGGGLIAFLSLAVIEPPDRFAPGVDR